MAITNNKKGGYSMDAVSKDKNEKIRMLKSELAQTESVYSEKIKQLRQEEMELRRNLADRSLLTEKLIEKTFLSS